jgi:hypothetical protein
MVLGAKPIGPIRQRTITLCMTNEEKGNYSSENGIQENSVHRPDLITLSINMANDELEKYANY